MKNAIFAFAALAVLLMSFGCAQAQPQPMPGSDRDEHGCIPSAGYTWCEPLKECIRPWETNCTFSQPPPDNEMMPGSDRDEHGCIASAGYTWCAGKNKCLRLWEENCTAQLAAKSDVRIITESFPPFSFMGSDGTAKGRSTAVVRGILLRLGQAANIEVLPWSEGYGLALNTSNVALYSTARTLSRDPLFKWVGPIGSFEKALYAQANSTLAIASLEDAKKAGSVCVVKDDVREQMLAERGFSNLLSKQSDGECIASLLAGEADLWFGSVESEPFSTFLAGIDPDSLKMAYTVEKSEIFIAFSSSTPDATVVEWQSALDGMKKDGFYDALIGQYKVTAVDSTGAKLEQIGPSSLAAFQSMADGKLSAISSDLQSAAAASSVQSGDWGRISATLAPLAAKYNYTLFWYALPNGTYYAYPAGAASGSLSERAYFKEVMAGNASVGTLVSSKSTGKNAVVVAVPIMAGMHVAGMLGSSTYLDGFSNEVASALDLPDYMYFFAMGGNGQVALHSDASNIMEYPATFGGALIANGMETIATTGNGTVDYDLNGRMRRAMYGTTPTAGWHYVIAEYLE